MTFETTLLLDRLGFPEGPRWRDGKLWFSDMGKRRVMTVDLDGHAETILDMPTSPSGLGWLPDGRLLVVSMDDRRLLRLDPDGLVEHADLSALSPVRCNDMVVDRQGRAYVGSFGYSWSAPYPRFAPATIVLVTPDGEARVVANDMAFPNGTVITPDGRTLVVAESFGARLSAFDIASDGSLTNRRVWAQLDDFPLPDGSLSFQDYGTCTQQGANGGLGPDGICLDAEGAIWLASPMSAEPEVVRVREGGELTHRVKMPISPFACMLGGADRRTLFVLCSSLGEEGSGRIETMRVDVPGAGLP